jgi:hypothetical protein
VDKVPKKRRWSSTNPNPNYSPIWPPIIKVQNYERRNGSGISVGSGFTTDESLTDGQDVLSSIGGEITEDEIVRQTPERRTSYRIRYDGPTTFKRNAEIHNLPRVQNDDRFEPTSKPSDGAPHMPSRPRDSIVDSTPCAPPRRKSSILEDSSIDIEPIDEKNDRPDVWITPSSGTTPYEAMWKVKRVWALEKQDEEEDEHSVDKQELFQKIKALVGAPESPPPKDGMPTMPSRSWHIQTVVERRGKLEGLEAAKEVDDEEFETNINVMAEEAVKEIEKNVKAIEESKRKKELEKDTKDTDDKALEQVADETLPLEAEPESPAVQKTSPLPEKEEEEVVQVEVTPEVQESSTKPAPQAQDIEVAPKKAVPVEPSPEVQETTVAPEEPVPVKSTDEVQESDEGDAHAKLVVNIRAGRVDDEFPAPVEVTKEDAVDVKIAGKTVGKTNDNEVTAPVIPGLSDLEEEPKKTLDVPPPTPTSKRKEKKGNRHRSSKPRKSKARNQEVVTASLMTWTHTLQDV